MTRERPYQLFVSTWMSLLLLAGVGACSSGGGNAGDGKSPGGSTQSNGQSAGATAGAGVGSAAPPAVMQILASNVEGRSYKCTVCHSEYLDPKVLNRQVIRNKIIDSITDGSMPLEGDRVSPQDLAILRAWAAH